ncbi:hypothetical protein [Algoriella sp.]|uniref:hypothetical protein n=1 Tax=Algoriella sp. TaxID=1872434 RepID=UPI002FCC9174
MTDLNKYNTALDLSKLSAGEIKSILSLIEGVNEKIYHESRENLINGEFDIHFPYLVFNEDTNQYTESADDDYILIESQTFKQIHFNAKTH